MTQQHPGKIVCALSLGCALLLSVANAQVRSVYDTGATGLALVLQQMQTTASIMHTGAHPDDEDSALLAYLARREHADTTYLSLSRGDGGQNVIGPELFEALGVIRTEELLQARKLDGASQLFTGAIDFGFSKNRIEAAQNWDETMVLGQMVRAIRLFRPTVIISRWSGTPDDGHGHHQFSGYLTPIAYAAAADPAQFPEHMEEGLTPWQAQKLYVSERNGSEQDNEGALQLDTGEYDPVLGRSYFEVAMEGRSQQKTQQMGQLELHGAQSSQVRLIATELETPNDKASIFDGIDTSIKGLALYELDASDDFLRILDELERTVADALESYAPLTPQKLIPTLASGLLLARRAGEMAANPDAMRLLQIKVSQLETALRLSAGVMIDAIADTETVIPGDSLQVAIRAFAPEGADVDVADLYLVLPERWVGSVANESELKTERDRRRKERANRTAIFDVLVPADAELTQPYWLERASSSRMYDWSTAGDAKNQPFRPPLLEAEAQLVIGGAAVLVRQEVNFRSVDRVRGELRRPVNVVPPLSIAPASKLMVVPSAKTDQRYELLLTVANNMNNPLNGSATFDVPAGWELEPKSLPFFLANKNASTALGFELTVPGNADVGAYPITAVANADSRDYRQTLRKLSYSHTQTHRYYVPSDVRVELLDLRVAPVRVGYVMGSGDQVPEAIRRLGIEVVLLGDDDLAVGDLSRFDTIVVGIRASQMRPAFVANNGRLLDFARQGGTLIVQYQQHDYIEKNLAPYPASMDNNIRVTDETALVTILEPAHAIFNFPNRIGPADFDNWVQERNAYTFTDFDRSRYTPLLESHDALEDPSVGGMVYAKLGEGHYVYTSYAWFRQLPQGVPGSYRIFANLLSLPKAP